MIQLIANILNTHLSGKMCFSDHMNAWFVSPKVALIFFSAIL